MPHQTSFADFENQVKKRLSRRERFLNEMEHTVPCAALLAVIETHYPATGRRGCQPIPSGKAVCPRSPL